MKRKAYYKATYKCRKCKDWVAHHIKLYYNEAWVHAVWCEYCKAGEEITTIYRNW